MKLPGVLLLLMLYSTIQAQSLDEGKKQLYYERYLSAKQSFQQAIKEDPANGEAWFNLVKTYILLKENKKAIDTLLAAPSTLNKDLFFRVARGIGFLQNNPKEQSISWFNNILDETKKKDEGVAAAVAWVQVNANGYADYAIDILNKALKKDKHNPELYILLGDAWRKQANGTEAFKAYQHAIDEDRKYAAGYYRMGQIFLSQKNKDVYTDYFQKAVAADPLYAPAWYRLYLYEFNRNPAQAKNYYTHYMNNADHTLQTEYDLADLLYLNKQYDEAIEKAVQIINREQDKTKPRLFKLVAYSNAGKKDTAAALTAMTTYLDNEEDSNIIAKDYESMSEYTLSAGKDSLSEIYLSKAAALEEDSSKMFSDYKKLADLAKQRKDYAAQAKWLAKYCTGNANASNLDLFYWGIAYYRIEQYALADSVFGLYTAKYPDQSFGYYWQAKSKALQDTAMVTGIAIPVYQKLIEVLTKDTADENYKKWITEAYGYLAAYAVNSKKDYTEGISYFQKVLDIDPDNTAARKYVDVLSKRLKKSQEEDTAESKPATD